MNQEVNLPVFVRPLSMSVLDEQLPINVSHEPGDIALRILADLLGEHDDPLAAARKRYQQVAQKAHEPWVVPLHDDIVRYVIRPLREAKQCYVLGMPVACIAQAGLVGEMVALWRFRMLETRVDGRPFDEQLQKSFWGQAFDSLRQVQRVDVLKALDTLDEDTVRAFTELRKMRNCYLHNRIAPEQNTDQDALAALRCANTLVTKTLNATYRDGRIVLPDRVLKYIAEILKPEQDEPVAASSQHAEES